MTYKKLTKSQRLIQRINNYMDDHVVEIGMASYVGLWLCYMTLAGR